VPLQVIHLEAPPELVRARMEARADDPERVSDADLDVYLHARDRFEPPTELPPDQVLHVWSERHEAEEEIARLFDRRIASTS